MIFKKTMDKFQKITDLDHTFIFKSGSWLMLNQSLSIFLGIILSIAFARLATKDAYGIYQFVLSVMGLLAIFALPGLDVALSQSVAKGYNNSILKSFKTKMKWSLIGSFILVCFSIYLKYFKASEIWSYFLIGSLFFPFLQIAQMINQYYIGKKNFKQAFFYNATVVTLYTSAIILFLYLKLSLFLIILVDLFISGIVPLLFYYKIKKDLSSKNLESDDDLVRYGKNITLTKAMKVILENIDKIIVTYFLGFAAGAVYSVAMSITGGLRGILNLANPLFISKATTADESKMFAKLKRNLWLLFAIPLVIIVIFWILNPYLMKFFFSDKYSDAILYSQFMLISLLFTLVDAVVGTIIFAKKMRKELYLSNGLHFVVRISTLLIMVPLLGIMGAILSRIISLIVLCGYYLILVFNYRRLKN